MHIYVYTHAYIHVYIHIYMYMYVWLHAFHTTCMTGVLVAVEVGGTDHVDKRGVDGHAVFRISSLQPSQILQRTQ